MLNKIKQLKQFLLSHKLVLAFAFLFLLMIISSGLSNIRRGQSPFIFTRPVPVITPTLTPAPTPTSILQVAPVDNPDQRLRVLWNEHNIDQIKSVPLFSVTNSLINVQNIQKLATFFNFKDTDKGTVLKTGNYRWITDDQTLFASIPQNQVFYENRLEPSSTSPLLGDDQVLLHIQSYLQLLFGNEAARSFVPISNEIRYYRLYQDASREKRVSPTTRDKATIYEVSYRQTIGALPVVALSGQADIITIGIDRNNNITHLTLYGGIDTYTPQGATTTITTEKLKEITPIQAKRITAAGSVSFDTSFRNVAELVISVKKIELGYIQEGLALHPVFLIHADMSGKNLPKAEAIFSVSALP